MIIVLDASEGWVPMRTFLSVQEQDLLWELRAEGLPIRAVARRIGRSGGTVNASVGCADSYSADSSGRSP